MSQDFRELIALPVAFLVFLFAAQAAAGLTWRVAPLPVTTLASR